MINRAIIQRYLEGTATEEELRQLQTYLERKDLSLLRGWMARDWDQLPSGQSGLPPDISEAMLQRVKQKITQTKRARQSRLKHRQYWAIAAGMLLLVSLGLWLLRPASIPMLTYTTGYGEWKALDLPDGSWVKLNANSEIRYAARWKAGQDRRVWLDGEAFFQVRKKPDTGAKFQVLTKDLQVEVLGTSFNVNSRDLHTDVFLEEGKIKLSIDGQEELLQAGDFVAYSAQEKAVVKRQKETSAEEHTSWKDGILILKNEPIEYILHKVEEIYGVKFDVIDERLLTQLMTISVPMDKLEIAISVLEVTFKVKITKQGNQLVIQ